MTMQGKHVLITGGNTGIGKATATGLARLGASVTITSRDPAKGEVAVADIRRDSGNDAIDVMALDLASLADVRRFGGEFLARHARLDVFIANAGLILGERSETVDGFETTFGVNHLGHFLLTHLLLERLERSTPSRIVVLSSDAHRAAFGLDFDDLQARRGYHSFRAYARSKLANLLFVLELAERLRGTGVAVNAVHPGFVRSSFGADGDSALINLVYKLTGVFALTVEQGARTSIHVASAPELAQTTGQYFVRSKPARPSRYARDRNAALRLWELSEQLTGLAAADTAAA